MKDVHSKISRILKEIRHSWNRAYACGVLSAIAARIISVTEDAEIREQFIQFLRDAREVVHTSCLRRRKGAQSDYPQGPLAYTQMATNTPACTSYHYRSHGSPFENLWSPMTRIFQTALLAAVQGSMLALISNVGDPALWRTFRGFLYAGMFFDLGATLSSVYVAVQGAALPVLARQMAMDTRDKQSAPSLQIHEPDRSMPR